MLFLEPWFWVFAAVAVPGYWLCPAAGKLAWLIIASAVFHWHFAGPAGMAPIIVLAILTYATGLVLARGDARRLFAGAAVVLVGALGFYKYSEFAAASVRDFLSFAAAEDARAWLADWRAPAAPLAISFFTFEFVHYLYEVWVHRRPAIRNPLYFALFAIFFPTLASGPIKRFPDFVPQLATMRNPSAGHAVEGAKRVIRGLFKKICIADLLVEYIGILEDVPTFTAPLVVLLAILQGFRIYYDFAGYSDIAIGLAKLLNLRVPENFDRPYWSTSLRDFWRRWHMSLSSWIRDYIYIPLGGNRAHRAFNLFVAMALCGLWHGAAWNFVLWGIYHGLGLAIETAVRRAWPGLFRGSRLLALGRWAACYGFVSYGWLLFFYPIGAVGRMTGEAIAWCFAG
jgi:alginate O-acetyltransferase complex protein AlgI